MGDCIILSPQMQYCYKKIATVCCTYIRPISKCWIRGLPGTFFRGLSDFSVRALKESFVFAGLSLFQIGGSDGKPCKRVEKSQRSIANDKLCYLASLQGVMCASLDIIYIVSKKKNRSKVPKQLVRLVNSAVEDFHTCQLELCIKIIQNSSIGFWMLICEKYRAFECGWFANKIVSVTRFLRGSQGPPDVFSQVQLHLCQMVRFIRPRQLLHSLAANVNPSTMEIGMIPEMSGLCLLQLRPKKHHLIIEGSWLLH